MLFAVAGLCSMLFMTRGVAAPTSAATAPALVAGDPRWLLAAVEPEVLGAMPLSDDLPPNSIYKLSAVDIDGKTVSLAKYAGQPAIVVNVASF